MKKMFKDYKDMVLVPSCKWVRMYWKEYIGLTAAITLAELGYIFREEIKGKLYEYFSKKEES